MAEVEKKLQSSPEGLTDAEAKKRLTQYGPNEIQDKKTNSGTEVPLLLLGPDPVDESKQRVILSAFAKHWPGLFHHPPFAWFATRWLGSGRSGRPATRLRALKKELAIQAKAKRDAQMGHAAGARARAPVT